MFLRTSLAAALAVGLTGVATVFAATPVTIYGQYDLTTSLDWGASRTFETVFRGDVNLVTGEYYGETTERPFFPALGTLVGSTVRLVSDTLQQISLACTSGPCTTPSFSGFRVERVSDALLLGFPGVSLYPARIVTQDYPAQPVNFLPVWEGRVTGAPTWGWRLEPEGFPRETFRVTHEVIVPSGWTLLSHGAQSRLELNAEIEQTYMPFSRGRYAAGAGAAASKAGLTGDLEIASGATAYAILLRRSSAGTSSQNTELRDAEYALLGFGAGRTALAGGLFLHRPASGDDLQFHYSIPILQSPGFTFLYGAAKQIALKSGSLTSLRPSGALKSIGESIEQAGFSGLPGASSLPGTKDFMGGLEANARGYMHGNTFGSIDTLGDCLDSGRCSVIGDAVSFRSVAGRAFAMEASFTERSREQGQYAGLPMEAALFDSPVSQDEVYTVRLASFSTHAFVAIRNAFSGIEWLGDPLVRDAWLGLPVGDDFELVELGAAGIDLTQFVEQGVRSFLVYGLDSISAGDAVFGLRFMESGDATVQTLSVSAVPEPAAIWMLLCGVGVVGWYWRRGRMSQ